MKRNGLVLRVVSIAVSFVFLWTNCGWAEVLLSYKLAVQSQLGEILKKASIVYTGTALHSSLLEQEVRELRILYQNLEKMKEKLRESIGDRVDELKTLIFQGEGGVAYYTFTPDGYFYRFITVPRVDDPFYRLIERFIVSRSKKVDVPVKGYTYYQEIIQIPPQIVELINTCLGELYPEGVMSSEEYLQIIEPDTLEIIGDKERNLVHRDGDWHRAVHVIVTTRDGKSTLVQIRNDGRRDLSVGGHVDIGEDMDSAALREIKEELGIEPNKVRLKRIGNGYYKKIGRKDFKGSEGYKDDGIFYSRSKEIYNREISALYVYRLSEDEEKILKGKVETKEVIGAEFISINSATEEAFKNPDVYASTFKQYSTNKEVVSLVNACLEELYPVDSNVAQEDWTKRIVQIVDMLERIDMEVEEPGKGRLPQIVAIADYHGEINLFLKYIADAISQKIGKTVILDHKGFPGESIEKQLEEQGVDIGKIGLTFYLLGDFLDRGKYGIKCFRAGEELVKLGIARYVTGNHDLWAFLNLMAYHLPVYEGYNFYGHKKSEELVKEHWNDQEIARDRIGWWTEKLAEYNEAQKKLQGEIFNGNIKEIRGRFKDKYLGIKEQLTPEEKELLEDLVGYYFGTTDVYTGFNGVGMMSVQWWKERLNRVNNILLKVRGGESEMVIDFWEGLKKYIEEASIEVSNRLEQAISEGKWWWKVFNDINHMNYTSVEWWGKDWASHEGWGTSVIDELNELEGEKKWNQANYIKNLHLQALARFYRKNFRLYIKDPYGNIYTHGWLPIDENGQVRFTYKGVTYEGNYIWEGLEIIQNDIRDLNNSLSELHEALELVNSWYADKTTRIKPENLKRYFFDIGLEKIYTNLGIKCWFTCHNPLNKLHSLGIGFKAQQGECVHFSIDKGMSWKKFSDLGGYVVIGPNGVILRGFNSPDFKEVINNPPTIKLKEDKEKKEFTIQKTWDNEPLDRGDFLNMMRRQLEEELNRLKRGDSKGSHLVRVAPEGEEIPIKSDEEFEPYKERFSFAMDRLRHIYGPGIFTLIRETRIVENLNVKGLYPAGRAPLAGYNPSDGLLKIDKKLFGYGRWVLFEELEHEYLESIGDIIPGCNRTISDVVSTYINVLRFLDPNMGVTEDKYKVDVEEYRNEILEELGKELDPDKEYLALLKGLLKLERKGALNNDLVAASVVGYVMRTKIYEDVRDELGLPQELAIIIKIFYPLFEDALRVFGEIKEAKQGKGLVEKVKESEGLTFSVIKTFTGARIQGLDKIDKRLAEVTAVLVKIASKMEMIASLPLAMTEGRYYIVVDRNRITKEMEDAMRKLEENKVFKVVYEVPIGYDPKKIIRLVDPADLREGMREDILYLPMPYLRSSLYMAAHVVSAGGEAARIDPLVKGLIIDLYKITDEELIDLFNTPWKLLPKIQSVISELNKLRDALAEIEKAA